MAAALGGSFVDVRAPRPLRCARGGRLLPSSWSCLWQLLPCLRRREAPQGSWSAALFPSYCSAFFTWEGLSVAAPATSAVVSPKTFSSYLLNHFDIGAWLRWLSLFLILLDFPLELLASCYKNIVLYYVKLMLSFAMNLCM